MAAKWDVIQKWWVTRCGMVCNPLHERRWSKSVESHSDVISVIPYGMPHKNKTTFSQLWWLTTTINSSMLQWAWSTRKQNKCGKTHPFGSNKKCLHSAPNVLSLSGFQKKAVDCDAQKSVDGTKQRIVRNQKGLEGFWNQSFLQFLTLRILIKLTKLSQRFMRKWLKTIINIQDCWLVSQWCWIQVSWQIWRCSQGKPSPIHMLRV